MKYSFQNSEKKYNAIGVCPRNNAQVHNNARDYMSNLKNVERYARLVDIYTGLGGTNTPGQRNLQVENLLALLTRSRQALTKVNEARTGFENVNEDRKKVFVEIHGLASRILSELKSSGASPDTVASAAAVVRKIQARSSSANRPAVASGEAAASAATTTPAPTTRIRTNGSGYGSVVYHFEKLLQTAASEPLYQPQIPALQLQGLQNKLADLQNGNAAVSSAYAQLGQARRDRNAVLYVGPESLYSTAQAMKHKVKAMFGARSDAARAVAHIRLNKVKIK
jgi:hypothetical protein